MISHIGLRYFMEVTRCRSIREAAKNLHVVPSAVSRQIGQLEEELGALLIDRSRPRHGLLLTEAGEVLLGFGVSLESEALRLRNDIAALKGLSRGSLRLGIPDTLVRDFIPEVLQSFNQQYPQISYFVEAAGTLRLLDLVAADQIDVALTFNPPTLEEVDHVWETFFPAKLLVNASHPLAKRSSVNLSDIADHGLALPDHTLSTKSFYDSMFMDAEMKPRAVLVTNSYELMRTVAIAGLCASIVTEYIAHSDDAQTMYRFVPISDARVRPQRFTVCVRRGRKLPQAASAFIEHLKGQISKLQEKRVARKSRRST